MALYIAVCNDSVSYRKQLERLLDRENDIRVRNSDVLYIDSYGNAEALFASPMKYDLFILDVRSGDDGNLEIFKKLRGAGVSCPIACLTEVNYLVYHMGTARHVNGGRPVSEPVFMEKFLNKEKLANLLDYAVEIKRSKIPSMELRTETDTFYVPFPEIIFAEAEGHLMNVYLTGDHVVRIVGDAEKFSLLTNGDPAFLKVGKSRIINLAHVRSVKSRRILMTDDHVINIPALKQSAVLARYHAYLEDS